MPTYTILGATGATGGALVDVLLKDHPEIQINAYVRSKAKLLHQKPGIDQLKNVNIVEGALSDVERLASMLGPDVDAVFCVTGVNENVPGMRIAQDTANAVIAALCHRRRSTHDTKDTAFRTPRLLFLSSASVSPVMSSKQPTILKAVVSRAFSHNYADLEFAERTLRLHRSWLHVTFIQPAGLANDLQRGHRLSVETSTDESGFVGYMDLAAGMIEIVQLGQEEYDEKYAWKGVAVVATSKEVKFEANAPRQALRGLIFHFVPALYKPCQYLGLTW